MLAKCFDFHRDSVTNHVEALVKRGVLEVTKNFVTSEIPTNSGVQQPHQSLDKTRDFQGGQKFDHLENPHDVSCVAIRYHLK